MAKDPAFLFYSKDWLEGTAELMPNEKGVYIDLLCYQHQKGDLPTDIKRLCRLVRLSIDEFTPIWDVIKDKFKTEGERIFNERMNVCINERSQKAKKNKIIGVFSSLLRKENLSKKNYAAIKKEFKADDFMQFDSERINERINEWWVERLKSIENATANENENENNINIRKERFEKEVMAYTGKYESGMLEKFCKYWTETNREKTKMKFEIKQTWDLSGRLATWYTKEFEFKRTGVNGKSDSKKESRDNITELARKVLSQPDNS